MSSTRLGVSGAVAAGVVSATITAAIPATLQSGNQAESPSDESQEVGVGVGVGEERVSVNKSVSGISDRKASPNSSSEVACSSSQNKQQLITSAASNKSVNLNLNLDQQQAQIGITCNCVAGASRVSSQSNSCSCNSKSTCNTCSACNINCNCSQTTNNNNTNTSTQLSSSTSATGISSPPSSSSGSSSGPRPDHNSCSSCQSTTTGSGSASASTSFKFGHQESSGCVSHNCCAVCAESEAHCQKSASSAQIQFNAVSEGSKGTTSSSNATKLDHRTAASCAHQQPTFNKSSASSITESAARRSFTNNNNSTSSNNKTFIAANNSTSNNNNNNNQSQAGPPTPTTTSTTTTSTTLINNNKNNNIDEELIASYLIKTNNNNNDININNNNNNLTISQDRQQEQQQQLSFEEEQAKMDQKETRNINTNAKDQGQPGDDGASLIGLNSSGPACLNVSLSIESADLTETSNGSIGLINHYTTRNTNATTNNNNNNYKQNTLIYNNSIQTAAGFGGATSGGLDINYTNQQQQQQLGASMVVMNSAAEIDCEDAQLAALAASGPDTPIRRPQSAFESSTQQQSPVEKRNIVSAMAGPIPSSEPYRCEHFTHYVYDGSDLYACDSIGCCNYRPPPESLILKSKMKQQMGLIQANNNFNFNSSTSSDDTSLSTEVNNTKVHSKPNQSPQTLHHFPLSVINDYSTQQTINHSNNHNLHEHDLSYLKNLNHQRPPSFQPVNLKLPPPESHVDPEPPTEFNSDTNLACFDHHFQIIWSDLSYKIEPKWYKKINLLNQFLTCGFGAQNAATAVANKSAASAFSATSRASSTAFTTAHRQDNLALPNANSNSNNNAVSLSLSCNASGNKPLFMGPDHPLVAASKAQAAAPGASRNRTCPGSADGASGSDEFDEGLNYRHDTSTPTSTATTTAMSAAPSSGPGAQDSEAIEIFTNLNGTIKSGQLTAILGPSGAGKTSLLNCLTGKLRKGVSGHINLVGAIGTQLKICTIPQKDHLLDLLTVEENLWFASKIKNPASGFDHAKNIERVVELLGLKRCLGAKIKKISGGQHKRVSIAQELLSNPDILVLDEPTSGLDSLTCYKTISMLRELVELSTNNEYMKPMAIIVTIHQPQPKVFNLFHHVYILANGGRIIYEGNPTCALKTITQVTGLEPMDETATTTQQVNGSSRISGSSGSSGISKSMSTSSGTSSRRLSLISGNSNGSCANQTTIINNNHNNNTLLSSSNTINHNSASDTTATLDNHNQSQNQADDQQEDSNHNHIKKLAGEKLVHEQIDSADHAFVHHNHHHNHSDKKAIPASTSVDPASFLIEIASEEYGSEAIDKLHAFQRDQFYKIHRAIDLQRDNIRRARRGAGSGARFGENHSVLLPGKLGDDISNGNDNQQLPFNDSRSLDQYRNNLEHRTPNGAALGAAGHAHFNKAFKLDPDLGGPAQHGTGARAEQHLIGAKEASSAVGEVIDFESEFRTRRRRAMYKINNNTNNTHKSNSKSSSASIINSGENGSSRSSDYELDIKQGKQHDRAANKARNHPNGNGNGNGDGLLYLSEQLLHTRDSDHRGKFWSHTLTLTRRTFLTTRRDPLLMTSRVLFHLMIPILMAHVYGKSTGKANACPNYEPEIDITQIPSLVESKRVESMLEELHMSIENVSMFFIIMYAFSAAVLALNALSFPLNMQVLLKETRNGWYGMSSYVVAKTLADLPLELTMPSITMALVYPLTGQPSSYLEWRMLTICLIMTICSLIAQTQALIIGAVVMNSVQTAVFVSQASQLPWVILAGFTIRIKRLSEPLKLVSLTSFYRLGCEAITLTRYGFGICPCNPKEITGQPVKLVGIPDQVRVMAQYWLDSRGNSSPSNSNETDSANDEYLDTESPFDGLTTTTESPLSSTSRSLSRTARHIITTTLRPLGTSSSSNADSSSQSSTYSLISDAIGSLFGGGASGTGSSQNNNNIINNIFNSTMDNNSSSLISPSSVINYETTTATSSLIAQHRTTNKADIFQHLANQLSYANSYGVNITSCADVTPDRIRAINLDDSWLVARIWHLFIMLIIMKIILYYAVTISIRIRL